MFKSIPGNSKFQIDLFGNFKTIDKEQECTPFVYENKVSIELYGRIHTVDVKWLALLAHFEVYLPSGLEHHIFDIHFTDTDLASKSVTNKMMIIRKPILIDLKYRIVPCFTNYAISNEGELIELSTRKVIESNKLYKDHYVYVSIYDPEYSGKRNFVLHRLVAMAWVYNKDYLVRSIVNHKNGNKQCFHYKNLEWVSYSENSLHAVDTSLRNDNVPCRVFDIVDKSVKEFQSIKQACSFMGIRKDSKFINIFSRTRHRLINDRYQIKLSTDNTEWFYENNTIGTVAGRYEINIEKSDGTKEICSDVRTFKRLYKVWNVNSIGDILEKAKNLYPEWIFSYKDHYVLESVQAYEVETGKIIEAGGIRQMSRLLNMEYVTIRGCLLAGETRVAKGYAFRYKTDTKWNTEFTEFKCSPKCILATNLETCETMKFDSERKASRYFGVERCVISSTARNQNSIKGYKLKYEK